MRLAPLAIFALLALPAAAALPVLCGTDCRIGSSTVPGYDPALAVIASGSTVTWSSSDIAHLTRDVSMGADACFEATHSSEKDSPAVRFDIDGDVLTATVDGITLPCAGASGGGDAGFALQYFCVLHPLMRGALVVTG